jgi:hypothetical protein
MKFRPASGSVKHLKQAYFEFCGGTTVAAVLDNIHWNLRIWNTYKNMKTLKTEE